MSDGNTFLDTVQGHLERAAALVHVPEHVLTILRQPKTEIIVNEHRLQSFVHENGSISGYANGVKITREEFFATEADLFVPAALENQLGAEEAKLLEVKLVAEGANGPTTPAGDAVLAERGIFVIPDILANAGGVTVSYYEWVQNRRSEKSTIDEVERRLELAMRHTYQRVMDFSEKHGCDARTACYAVAIERLTQAYLERGIFP